MMHDMECGGVCKYPGCREECVYAACSCNGHHVCSKHMNEKFQPERRATVSVSVEGKTVSVTVSLSATLEFDNMLNVARAADQLVQKAFYGK